jgi:hypothetical protein
MSARDANDIYREQGEAGVRAMHDSARKFDGGRYIDPPPGQPPRPLPLRKNRFKLIPFSELRPTTTPNYLVKGLIPRTGLVVVWGPPKCGKSFWVFDLTMHIAARLQYRDRRTRQGPAVYCAFEGADGFKVRAQAFRQQHNIADDVPFYLVPAVINLITDHAELISSIAAQTTTPAVVVLDTLNRSLVGSESSDEDMANYVKAADAIREKFGCAVIIVHHCGVEGTRPRGHTSLTGACDAQLAVKRDAQHNIIVTVEHMKDGPEGATIGSRLEYVELGVDDDGDPITSCVVIPIEGDIRSKPEQKFALVPTAALRELIELTAKVGTVGPASEHIPRGVTGVTLDSWREHLMKTQLINREGGYREQFRRIHVKLKNAGAIGVWENFVWPVT